MWNFAKASTRWYEVPLNHGNLWGCSFTNGSVANVPSRTRYRLHSHSCRKNSGMLFPLSHNVMLNSFHYICFMRMLTCTATQLPAASYDDQIITQVLRYEPPARELKRNIHQLHGEKNFSLERWLALCHSYGHYIHIKLHLDYAVLPALRLTQMKLQLLWKAKRQTSWRCRKVKKKKIEATTLLFKCVYSILYRRNKTKLDGVNKCFAPIIFFGSNIFLPHGASTPQPLLNSAPQFYLAALSGDVTESELMPSPFPVGVGCGRSLSCMVSSFF